MSTLSFLDILFIFNRKGKTGIQTVNILDVNAF
jgi:hypothetical protein